MIIVGVMMIVLGVREIIVGVIVTAVGVMVISVRVMVLVSGFMVVAVGDSDSCRSHSGRWRRNGHSKRVIDIFGVWVIVIAV